MFIVKKRSTSVVRLSLWPAVLLYFFIIRPKLSQCKIFLVKAVTCKLRPTLPTARYLVLVVFRPKLCLYFPALDF